MPKEPEHPSPDPREEADLARAACAGDEQAYAKLFKLLYPRVHRTIWGMLADEAEAHDITQEAFIRGWEKRGSFNFQSRISTWLHRIAINLALDLLRGRNGWRKRLVRLIRHGEEKPLADPPADPKGIPREVLQNRELGIVLQEAVEQLPEDQRTVLVLREYEGYSYREIAEIVGCRPGTVMSRLHLARQKLQKRISRELS